jgi:phosphoribosyl 1,2-cyclic phosphodiesterase
VELLVLESNHDIETLRSGPYPYYLKERILGAYGHLSNEDAGRFAAEMARHGTKEIVLAHLSRENNTPAMALQTVQRYLDAHGLDVRLSAAPRKELSRAYEVEVSPCRK